MERDSGGEGTDVLCYTCGTLIERMPSWSAAAEMAGGVLEGCSSQTGVHA